MYFFAFILPLFFFLSGCGIKVGPDFSQDSLPKVALTPKNNLFDASAEVNQTIDTQNWWNNFDDPNLTALILSAQKNNIPLQVQALKIMEAQAVLGITNGEWYPQEQTIGTSYFWEHAKKADTNNFGLSGNIVWELDIWGKYARGIEAASADVGAEIEAYKDDLVNLNADVALAYIDMRIAEAKLKYGKENVKIQRRAYNIANALYENGATDELDIRQASSLLYSTEASLPAITKEAENAKNNLALLLGITPSQIDTKIQSGTIPTVRKTELKPVDVNILRQRPDVRERKD